MICPNCGYLMEAFDKECLRCHGHKLLKENKTDPHTQNNVREEIDPHLASSLLVNQLAYQQNDREFGRFKYTPIVAIFIGALAVFALVSLLLYFRLVMYSQFAPVEQSTPMSEPLQSSKTATEDTSSTSQKLYANEIKKQCELYTSKTIADANDIFDSESKMWKEGLTDQIEAKRNVSHARAAIDQAERDFMDAVVSSPPELAKASSFYQDFLRYKKASIQSYDMAISFKSKQSLKDAYDNANEGDDAYKSFTQELDNAMDEIGKKIDAYGK